MRQSTRKTTTPARVFSREEGRHAYAGFTLLLESHERGKAWLRDLLGGRDIRDVPADELIGIVTRLDKSRERELVITNLFVAAPQPLKKGWIDELTSGRAIAAVPTAELRQIVARLEAAAA